MGVTYVPVINISWNSRPTYDSQPVASSESWTEVDVSMLEPRDDALMSADGYTPSSSWVTRHPPILQLGKLFLFHGASIRGALPNKDLKGTIFFLKEGGLDKPTGPYS